MVACGEPPENGFDSIENTVEGSRGQSIALPMQLRNIRALPVSGIQGFLQVDGDKIHMLTLNNG